MVLFDDKRSVIWFLFFVELCKRLLVSVSVILFVRFRVVMLFVGIFMVGLFWKFWLNWRVCCLNFILFKCVVIVFCVLLVSWLGNFVSVRCRNLVFVVFEISNLVMWLLVMIGIFLDFVSSVKVFWNFLLWVCILVKFSVRCLVLGWLCYRKFIVWIVLKIFGGIVRLYWIVVVIRFCVDISDKLFEWILMSMLWYVWIGLLWFSVICFLVYFRLGWLCDIWLDRVFICLVLS